MPRRRSNGGGAVFEAHNRPHEDGLIEVFDRVAARSANWTRSPSWAPTSRPFKRPIARFTGRAIKNITDAVKVRAMDFELPDEWMENPELFLFKDYDTKAR
jgi:hypothetical protein